MMFLESEMPPGSYIDNPHAHLADWRTEAPLQYLANPGLWLATSYDWIHQLMRDERLAVSAASTFAERSRQFRVTVVKRLRGFFGLPETPFIDAAVRDAVKDVVNHLVNTGEAELVSEVAQVVPRAVMGRLLGMPEAELLQVCPLTSALLSSYVLPGKTASPAMAKAMIDAYFVRHLERARVQEISPLMTLLIEAQREYGIDDEVLADVCTRLLTAGSGTTAGSLGNILLRLLRESECLPEIPSAQQRAVLVDELLRLETPLLGIKRQAEFDLDLPGVMIGKGQKVLLMVAAGNRDPAYFQNPDEIDFERTGPKHLGFGQGAFHCLGAPLARKEIDVLLEHLLPLLPAIRLLRSPTRKVGWLLYEPAEIPVRFEGTRHGK